MKQLTKLLEKIREMELRGDFDHGDYDLVCEKLADEYSEHVEVIYFLYRVVCSEIHKDE